MQTPTYAGVAGCDKSTATAGNSLQIEVVLELNAGEWLGAGVFTTPSSPITAC